MASAQAGAEFHKGGTVLVEGIPALVKKLRAAEADLGQMSDLMHSLGLIVISHATPPRDSGELAASMRAGRGKTKAVVRAGYAKRAAYAGVTHYGMPDGSRAPQPFLTDALKRSQGQVVAALTKGIDEILRTNNLT